MRALVCLLALAVCATGATAALAAKPKPRKPKPPVPAAGVWKGQRLESGSVLRLRVAKSRKTIGRVKANVLETCLEDEPQTTTTLSSRGGWKIRKGRFTGRRRETAGRVVTVVSIAGQFTSPTRASGVLRQKTTIAGVTCDTGRLPFVAVRR